MSIDKEKEDKWILIGAGEWNIERPLAMEDNFLVAVDGGMDFCLANGLLPDLYIGDLDSLSESSRNWLKSRSGDSKIILPCEKDDTDMLAAIKEGMKRGASEFVIYGGLGKRLEHTIANIQCLIYLKKNNCRGYLLDKDVKIYVLKDEVITYPEGKTGYFSLFSIEKEASDISICGMKYPLNHATITNDFPIGVSNEFIGTRCKVTVGPQMVLIIESKKRI